MENTSRTYFWTILLLLSAFIGHAQTPCAGGMAAGYPCDKIDLMAFMPLASIGGVAGAKANDIWGWTDSLSGKEYAIVGLNTGTSFVDISDPVNPIYLGFLPTATGNSTWRDMKVYNNHAFIVSEAGNHGVQSFDLRTLRTATPGTTFTQLAHFTNIGTGGAHNIVGLEETGYMVVVGANCSGGLLFINVKDPANMTLDGCFSADGYTHDAVCFVYQGPDTEHYGKEICIGSNADTQTFVDVTDKTNPIQLSRRSYTGVRYTHQGWITPDHKYLIFDDELDETNNSTNTRTFMMDISDLDNPVNLGFYEATTTNIDHNQYIKGHFTYQANYRGGIRILDSRNVAAASLTEVAFFDTYPTNDNPNFNSAWSVFPYFKSGNIIVSDIEQGMFILRPTLSHFVMESERVAKTVCVGSDVIFNIDLTAYAGYSNMVALSVTGVPPGATATFGSSSLAPNGSTTLTISNTNGVSGPYSLLLQARGPLDNSVDDVSVSFKVLEPPNASIPVVPANNATNVDPVAVLSWSAAPEVESYTVSIATDAGFSAIARMVPDIPNNSYVANPGLANGTDYFWRVTGKNACGESIFSNTSQFRTTENLPVELVDFSGNLIDRQVELSWETFSETNNAGFEILRGTASETFRKIGWVAGKGNTLSRSEYAFTDATIGVGETYYYQLRQLDEGGEARLSDVISIKVVGKEKSYSLFPNPTNGNAQLSMILPNAEELTIKVLDLSGKEQAHYDITGRKGQNKIDLDTKGLMPGVYLIQVRSEQRMEALRMVVL